MAAPVESGQENGKPELSRSRSRLQWNRLVSFQDDVEDISSDGEGLPPRGSRNGKWWYSTYHNVTAMVGAGVLGLPTTMAYLGWGAGTMVLVASWVITLYTLWQMVQMHEMDGKRLDTYHQLGQEAFGPKWGLYIVVPQQLIVEVGLDIVYIVTGGQCLWNFYRLVACKQIAPVDIGKGECCGQVGPTTFLIIFAVPQFFLAQLGSFNSIAGVSLAASMMSIGYCTIAWSLSIGEGHDNHGPTSPVGPVSYVSPPTTMGNRVFGAFSALGTVAFAHAGHNVVLEIQATLPSREEKKSKVLMWRGVVVAYLIVAFCYLPVTLVCYWAFGNSLALYGPSTRNSGFENPSSGNILLRLRHPRWLLALVNLMVVIHMSGSYQLYAMPAFHMMETLLVKKFGFGRVQSGSPSPMRILTRSTYVFITAFLACTFPFFNSLLGFVGGLALAPTSYFLPCIIWLKIKRPPFGISWVINRVLIIVGLLLMVIATIGGARGFIVQLKSFQFYEFTTSECRP